MPMLDDDELRSLLPAETSAFPSPIPTQFVSSDEFLPAPQTERQKQVEARIKALGSKLARHQGMTRRRFFETAAGMAAAFLVMNDVYGPLFDVSKAEAATPDMADERALADQLIMDMHTHFLRDDTRLEGFVRSRAAVGKAGWNPALAGKPLGPADGAVKRMIFGDNSARLYKYDQRAELGTDRIALAKAQYEASGGGRTNLRYGYVAGPTA